MRGMPMCQNMVLDGVSHWCRPVGGGDERGILLEKSSIRNLNRVTHSEGEQRETRGAFLNEKSRFAIEELHVGEIH